MASGRRVLAVSGDGGAAYGLAELATAAQLQAPVTWLSVDDGGYGILDAYMTRAFGEANERATRLLIPDFVEVARACGVRACTASVMVCPMRSSAAGRRCATARARCWR